MTPAHVLLLIALFAFLVMARVKLGRYRRRRSALELPFPDHWLCIIHENLPPYSQLAPEVQKQLQGYIQEFLYDKSFEGCGGLVLDDEIKVTIAAQAALLLLNREVRCYPNLFSVLVYPSTYVVREAGGQKSVRLGESWRTGAVVLAWDSVKHGAANFADGRNLVIHEFAHQLDQEDGAADGEPTLADTSSYTVWAQVLSTEYDRLQKKVSRRKKSVMNAYGATHPAEFFAVASETFFEKPRQLHKKHPELFAELQGFYQVDPREWV